MIMIWNKFSLSALFAWLQKLECGFQNTALLQFPLNKHDFFPGKLFHSGTTGLCTKTNMDPTAPVEPYQNILLLNRIIQAGLETYFLAQIYIGKMSLSKGTELTPPLLAKLQWHWYH